MEPIELKVAPSILTTTGKYFDLTRPESHSFPIGEIAAALSKLCRFTGHVREFYSVAQHAVLVSRLVPPELALAGLLHDAVEAYVGDVSTPLKQLLPEYKRLETHIEQVIYRRYGLPDTLPADVKYADLVALMTEERDLMPAHEDVWFNGRFTPIPDKICPLLPQEAEALFLARYYELQVTSAARVSSTQVLSTEGLLDVLQHMVEQHCSLSGSSLAFDSLDISANARALRALAAAGRVQMLRDVGRQVTAKKVKRALSGQAA